MNLDDITTGPLTAVAQIIDLEESLAQTQMDGSSRRWAFRGQPREYKMLTPSFQRQFTSPEQESTNRYFGTAEIIERKLIDAFRDHYLNLPDRTDEMPQPERIAEGYDLRCLSVMQHYEIPTRLLDWTSDFWIAIYFACASAPSDNAEIWLYDRQIFDQQRMMRSEFDSLVNQSINPPMEPAFLDRRAENLIVELDPRITPRMREQYAHHTVSANVFADHAPLLYALLENEPDPEERSQKMRRILIESSCKGKVLQFLAEFKDITASTVFPDVVGLGRFLRWQLESLRTMLL